MNEQMLSRFNEALWLMLVAAIKRRGTDLRHQARIAA